MILTDEDALICDFAEYYHIYDFRALPVKYAATLACGLGENSRIKKVLSGTICNTETLLLAAVVDRLSLIWWSKTQDGQKNINHPAMISELLQGNSEVNNGNTKLFNSGNEFISQWNSIIG